MDLPNATADGFSGDAGRGSLNEPLIHSSSKEKKARGMSAARKRWKKVKSDVIPLVSGLRKIVNADLSRPTPQRFQEALKGPELEDLDESESPVFSSAEVWPFLCRFPVNTFGICIGLSSQVALWKNLSSKSSVQWANLPSIVYEILWCITFFVFISILLTYISKASMWMGAVKREWGHPVRINFFFAPCITAANLCLSIPTFIATTVHHWVFVFAAIPLIVLDILVFGEWFSGKDRLLCDVANPTTNLAVCTNFVCANLAAITGWDEAALIFFSIGMGHYIAVFVSLYQQLPFSAKVPENMHPVYFMFVSPPCAAALAWSNISGSFDTVAKGFFFLAIFLYMCLVAKIPHFLQIRFTLSWWAYCFPITLAANTAINYADYVDNLLTRVLVFSISTVFPISSLFTVFFLLPALAFGLSLFAIVIVLCVTTVTVSKFVRSQLFPNDLAIFIKDTKDVSNDDDSDKVDDDSADSDGEQKDDDNVAIPITSLRTSFRN